MSEVSMRERYDEAMQAGNVEHDYPRALSILYEIKRDIDESPGEYTEAQRSTVATAIANLTALLPSSSVQPSSWPIWALGGFLGVGVLYWWYSIWRNHR